MTWALFWKIIAFPKDTFTEFREHVHYFRDEFRAVHRTPDGAPTTRVFMFYSDLAKNFWWVRDFLDRWHNFSWNVLSTNDFFVRFSRGIAGPYISKQIDHEKDVLWDLNCWANSMCVLWRLHLGWHWPQVKFPHPSSQKGVRMIQWIVPSYCTEGLSTLFRLISIKLSSCFVMTGSRPPQVILMKVFLQTIR